LSLFAFAFSYLYGDGLVIFRKEFHTDTQLAEYIGFGFLGICAGNIDTFGGNAQLLGQ